MNWKRFGITAVVIAVIVVIFEWVFHGVLLDGLYQRTAEAWRPQSEMESYMGWMLLGQLVMAVGFTWLYFGFVRQPSASTGAMFGLALAVVYAGTYLVYYAVQPIVPALAVYWMVGTAVECMLIGAIAGAMYQHQPTA